MAEPADSDIKCHYFYGLMYSALGASVTLQETVIARSVSNCDLKTLQQLLTKERQRLSCRSIASQQP